MEKTPLLGSLDPQNGTVSLAHIFDRPSVFFKNQKSNSYLEKWAIFKVIATSGGAPAEYPFNMGEVKYDLSYFVGNKDHMFKLPLVRNGNNVGFLRVEVLIAELAEVDKMMPKDEIKSVSDIVEEAGLEIDI